MKSKLFRNAYLICILSASMMPSSGIAKTDGSGRNIGPEFFSNIYRPVPYGETFPKISQIPPGGGANSSPIAVATTGTLRVRLSIRTAALFNTGGKSTYKVSLRRGNPPTVGVGGTEVASKSVIVNSELGFVDLSVTVGSCNQTGQYHVRVSNDSTENRQAGVVSSGILDGEIFASTSDPENRTLSMSGFSLIDLDRGDEKTVSIGSIAKPGTINLMGKWHVPGLIPTFKPLKIYLLRPNGTTATSGTYYSIHSNTGPKLDTYYPVTSEDVAQTGSWKLKIVNGSDSRIESFNIKKGSDPNPFVPSFASSFTTACGS